LSGSFSRSRSRSRSGKWFWTRSVSRSMPHLPKFKRQWEDIGSAVYGFPTLERIGLLPQLHAMERICAAAAAGKHAGESFKSLGVVHHLAKVGSHLAQSGTLGTVRDEESGELHLVHAAIRLLMAAACNEGT
jgi:hypothetical protein